MGWALIRGWALINFSCLWDGRLFEVGANSRLGAYSNKYGTPSEITKSISPTKLRCFRIAFIRLKSPYWNTGSSQNKF